MNKIIINSLPKSGTNLVARILELGILDDSKISFAASTSVGRHQIFKQCLRNFPRSGSNVPIGLQLDAAVSSKWLESKCSQVKNQSFLTGHAPFSHALSTILKTNDIKMILVVRHPLSVLLSWLHYIDKTALGNNHPNHHLKMLSMSARMTALIYGGYANRFFLNPFDEVLHRVQKWSEDENVMIVKFENIIGADGGGTEKAYINTCEKMFSWIFGENNQKIPKYHDVYGKSHTFYKGKSLDFSNPLLRMPCIEDLKSTQNYIDFCAKYGYLASGSKSK
jgi:hypothetical protein